MEVITGSKNNDVLVSPTGIPAFKPAAPGEYITPTTADKTPAQLAKEAGYKILLMSQDDNTGRTIFYDYRGGWGGGIGESYSEQNGTDGKTYRSAIYLTGSFVSFEAVPESKDQYITLQNPKTGELFPKIRVAFADEIFTTEGMKSTLLTVDNLSLDPDKASSLGINGRLGYMPQWGEDQLGKIIQPGDAIGISLTAVKGISTNILHEEGNIVTATYEPSFAGSILVRRFGGKGQIEKELASEQ